MRNCIILLWYPLLTLPVWKDNEHALPLLSLLTALLTCAVKPTLVNGFFPFLIFLWMTRQAKSMLPSLGISSLDYNVNYVLVLLFWQASPSTYSSGWGMWGYRRNRGLLCCHRRGPLLNLNSLGVLVAFERKNKWNNFFLQCSKSFLVKSPFLCYFGGGKPKYYL